MYTSQASNIKDKKRVLKSDRQVSAKHKKRREGEQQRRTCREEALREAEGETYGAASFNDWPVSCLSSYFKTFIAN